MENEDKKVDSRLLMEFRVFTAVMSLFAVAFVIGIVFTIKELGCAHFGTWVAVAGWLAASYGVVFKCLKTTVNGIKFAKTFDEKFMEHDWDRFTNGLWYMVGGIMVATIGIVMALV